MSFHVWGLHYGFGHTDNCCSRDCETLEEAVTAFNRFSGHCHEVFMEGSNKSDPVHKTCTVTEWRRIRTNGLGERIKETGGNG